MALFEKFTDTIFLKEDSELKRKYDYLNSIKEKVIEEDKNKFERDYKTTEYGLIGEDKVAFELKNADIGCYVLRDITIEYAGETAQIDYVIITRCNCYFVECKNMIGNITINKEGEFRREFLLNGKTIKEAIYSPYRQALRHIEMLKKIWRNQSGKLAILFGEKEFDKYYKPLIVMANPKGMLNNRYAPKEIKNVTIRVDQLIDYLKADLKDFDKNKVLLDNVFNTFLDKQQDIESYARGILKHHKKNSVEYSKLYRLKLGNDEELRSKLISFRTEMAKKNKVPAYYVFKNNELDEIIKTRPKTIEELSKVLQAVKVKVYGKEILNIVNESWRQNETY